MITLQFIPDQMLIRLSGFDPEDAALLRDACLSLSRQEGASIALHAQPWVNCADGAALTMLARSWNQDTVRIAASEFEWALMPAGWDNVAGLIEPFAERMAHGYQWLNQGPGQVRVLLSPSGMW